MNTKNNIILASQSPRRKELLKFIIKDFDVYVSDFDEDSVKCDNHYKYTLLSAIGKAKKTKSELINLKRFDKDTCIISGDTVVITDNDICLGKPKDKKQAFEFISLLNNKTHTVATAICIIKGNKTILFIDKSFVTFNKLTVDEIEEYLNTSQYLDKAGAYSYSEHGSLLVKKIIGDYYNICGLPVNKINKYLKGIGVKNVY